MREPEQLRQICDERGITTLLHFTRIENLSSILQKGLLGRSLLEESGQDFVWNDEQRLDAHKEAVCLSISFPNYRMFYSIREKKKETNEANDSQWVILLLDTNILWELDCTFFQENAASNVTNRIIPEARSGERIQVCLGQQRYFDVISRNGYPVNTPEDVPDLIVYRSPANNGEWEVAEYSTGHRIPINQAKAAPALGIQSRIPQRAARVAIELLRSREGESLRRCISLQQRKKPEALKSMFGDYVDRQGSRISRQDLQIPDNYPTNPQAEVHVSRLIPTQHIQKVHFWDVPTLHGWRSSNSETYSQAFSATRQYFQPRPDYAEWQSDNLDSDDIPEVDEPPGSLLEPNDIPF